MASNLYQEGAQLVRRDFCAGCWGEHGGHPPVGAAEGAETPSAAPSESAAGAGSEACGEGEASESSSPPPSEAKPSAVAAGEAVATGERISFWRTVVPEPEDEDARKRRTLDALLDADTLMDVFGGLSDAPSPERRRFRFILALMLMRRKKLKLSSISKRTTPDGRRDCLVLTTTGRKRKRQFDVVDVRMSVEEMMSAQEEVGRLLAMGGVEGTGGEDRSAAPAGGAAEDGGPAPDVRASGPG
jgi:hypothetical protein